MDWVKISLFALLGVFAAGLGVAWALEMTRRKKWAWPSLNLILVGVLTDFFDTLGIGSFATTTTLFRARHTVADERIPGTLNVGHALPTITQAFIFIALVEIEMKTLVLLISASVLGAWLGADVVRRLPRRGVQIGMGLALLAAAVFLLGGLLKFFPKGSDALGLDGTLLVVAVIGNFIIGALMTIGLGAYAPIMVLVSLLGMDPKASFPIMMGSCAFLMPVSGAHFIRADRYDAQAALGLTLGGIPAVLVAAPLVDYLSLEFVKWLVVGVVVYTAASMLWAAWRGRGEAARENRGSEAASV